MMIFNVDWNKLGSRITAPVHRKPRYLALLNLLFYPVKQVHESFLNYVALKRIEMSYTGQTMLMERFLNDQFDVNLRRIRVVHVADNSGQIYLYFESEGQLPSYLYFESEAKPPIYLYFEGTESGTITFNFLVKIPTELTAQTEQIRGAVRRYKVAGPTYDVTT